MKNYTGVCGLYEIRNLIAGKRYIGSSKNLTGRLSTHRKQLRRGIHPNHMLQGAWNKYGEAAFAFCVVALLIVEDQFPTEGRWIKACLAAGEFLYNLADDVKAPGKGYRHTPETRALRSWITTARFADPNERKKVSESIKRTLAADPTILIRRTAAIRAANLRPETQKKKSDAMKAYYANTPGAHEKTAAATRAGRSPMSAEERRAASERIQKQWENPESNLAKAPNPRRGGSRAATSGVVLPIQSPVKARRPAISSQIELPLEEPPLPHAPLLAAPAVLLEASPTMCDIPYLLTVNGETKTLTDWAKGIGITTHAIVFRLQNDWPPERAVSTPAPERPNAKLTLEQASQIRAEYPALSLAELAAQFSVSKKTVLNILRGKIFNDEGMPPVDYAWTKRKRKVKTTDHLITANGETNTVAEWARRLGLSPNTIHGRLKNGWTPQDAVTIKDMPLHNQKLTPEDAAAIRASYPAIPCTKLAVMFSVSKKSILNVLHYKTFKI